MTTACERTKAVIETRKFLQTLSSADEVTIRGLIQSVAVCLLRHYPNHTEPQTIERVRKSVARKAWVSPDELTWLMRRLQALLDC